LLDTSRLSKLVVAFAVACVSGCFGHSDSITKVTIDNRLDEPVRVCFGLHISPLLNSDTTWDAPDRYYIGGAGNYFDVYSKNGKRIGVLNLTDQEVQNSYSGDTFTLVVDPEHFRPPTNEQPPRKFSNEE
jgi:hypothetical protein